MNSLALGANVTTSWTVPSISTSIIPSGGFASHDLQVCFTQGVVGMPPTEFLSREQCRVGCAKVFSAMTSQQPVWCSWRGPDGKTEILDRGFLNLIAALPKTISPSAIGKDRVGYFSVNRTLGLAYKRAYVELSSASLNDVVIPYYTSGGSAIPGRDYIESSGVVVIPAGARIGEILIETTLEQVSNANIGKNFYIHLSPPVNGGAVLGNVVFPVSFQPVSARTN